MSVDLDLKEEIEIVTDNVRQMVESGADLMQDDVEQLNQRFVVCIKRVNKRLMTCSDLLRKGLRSEALQECQREPDLLELTAELDTPELDAWYEILIYFLLSPPPRLLLDLASDLNEAFVLEQSLDGLLRQHRLHALARSELKARISVLRALISKDPDNHAWREDLVAYETRRLIQLEDAFARNKGHDLASASAIQAELQSENWVAKCKPSFKADVDRLVQRLDREYVREQLVVIAKQLNQFFSELDLASARQSQKQWNHWIARTKLPSEDTLHQEVGAAFRWISEEEANEQQEAAFAIELKRFESILDRDAVDYEKATRQFRVVEKFQREIPPLVLKRFHSIEQSYEVLRRRKSQLLIGAVVLTFVGLGLCLGWYLHRSSYERHTATVLATVSELIEKSEHKQAQQVLEAQISEHPYLLSVPQIQSYLTTVEKAIGAEEKRSQLFEALLEKAEKVSEQGANWDSVADAEIALNQAKQHTDSGTAEATRIQLVDSEIRRKRRILQQAVNEGFQSEMSQIQTELKELSALSSERILQVQVQLQQLNTRPHVVNDLRQSVVAPLKQISAEIERRQRLEAQTKAFAAVLEAIGNMESLRLSLLAYREVDPNSVRGRDFQRVIEEDLIAIETAMKWNIFVAEWNGRTVSPLHQTYAAWERDLQVQKDDFPGVPFSTNLNRFKQTIDSFSSRAQQDPTAALRSLFSAPIVQKVMQIRNTATDQSHYFTAAPQIKGQRIEVAELVSVRGNTRVRTFDPKELQVFDGNTYVGDTPHAEWARRSEQYLDETEAATQGWAYEKRILAILNDLLERPGIDPLFACDAINQVMEIGMTHSIPLEKVLAGPHNRYQREVVEPLQAFDPPTKIDAIDWLSPTENERRRIAQMRIGEWRKTLNLAELVAGPLSQALQELENKKPRLTSFAWAGCLFRENEDYRFSRSLDWDSNQAGDGKLYAARIASNRVVGWQEIGSVVNGVVQLTSPSTDVTLRDGRPVFFIPLSAF